MNEHTHYRREGGSMKIWVIEDEKHLRKAVTKLLTNKGHKVESFENQNDAICAFDRGKPDGLITDFNLDGTNTCRPIIDKAIAEGVSRIVVMSGDPGNEDGLPKEVRFRVKPIEYAALIALFPTPTG